MLFEYSNVRDWELSNGKFKANEQRSFMMKPDKENEIIFSDAGKCLGCHSCELACAVAHGEGDLFEAAASGNLFHSRTRVVKAGASSIPVQCRQCENAPCAIVCPTSAMGQENGRVVIDEKNCVGCKLCIKACPFGAITVATEGVINKSEKKKKGVAKKCDLCAGLRDADGNGKQPACVEACPTRAITLVNLEAYRAALLDARAGELACAHNQLKL